jgi:hypothetical protein
MAQPKKQKTHGLFEAAAQAIGTALGTVAVKTGIAKPDPAQNLAKRARPKAVAKKKAVTRTQPRQKSAARKPKRRST